MTKKEVRDYSGLDMQEDILNGELCNLKVDINGLEKAVSKGLDSSFNYRRGSEIPAREAYNALVFKGSGYNLETLRLNNDWEYVNNLLNNLEKDGYISRMEEITY